MMMALGAFVFESSTLAYQRLQRTTSQRWASNNRTGQRAAHQHLGPGDDTQTLPGVVYAEISENGAVSVETLRVMADKGEPYIMIDGKGYVHGQWIILSVDETRTHFFDNGAAQKIEFNLKLKRYADLESNSFPLEAVINGLSV